jgi:dTDP-4-dehydrorhamnose reductase
MAHQRIIVLGATGQLGTDLVEVLSHEGNFEVFPISHQDADCTDPKTVRRTLTQVRPDIVVNCAAFVRVDECEERVGDAFAVNAVGAYNVAKACAEIEALCVYVSTDYVFDGAKNNAYAESDTPNPINVYGASKLAGEYLTRQAARRWLMVRTASLFGKTGARGKGGNFVETIIRKAKAGEPIRVINNITMSPTYSRDAAGGLAALLRNRATGLFHLVNQGACTWYEFAKTISDVVELGNPVHPVSSNEFAARALRPQNSALITEQKSVQLRPWKDALKAYLLEKGHLRYFS